MKSKTVAVLLAFFLGGLGVHKFYLGQKGQGILYLIFCWTYIPAIIAFIEGISYCSMSIYEFNNKFNKSEMFVNSVDDYDMSDNRYNQLDSNKCIPGETSDANNAAKETTYCKIQSTPIAEARRKMASAVRSTKTE